MVWLTVTLMSGSVAGNDRARRVPPGADDADAAAPLSEAVVTVALRAAATAELSWVGPGGPDGDAVTPLLRGGSPVLAVPYAYEAWARDLAALPEVVLTLSDPRLSGQRWKALALRARPRLVEDPEGDVFCDELLEDELRKHPPSRSLADSILLRRENWWFLPRLLLHLDVTATTRFVERFGRDEVLLVTADGPRVRVDAARASGWGTPTLSLEGLAPEGPGLPDGPDRPGERDAVLLGHDFTEPDMERWEVVRARGRLSSSALVSSGPVARPGVRGMPRLGERLRRHRDLRTACRQALKAR